jgi:orotidine-5'-phosphate decarboxylase
VNGPLLAPGLGAQGGSPADLRAIFGESLRNVLPSYSREVLGAGPEPVQLRAAADRAVTACSAVIE